jgi:ribosome-interacting GTPase 1
LYKESYGALIYKLQRKQSYESTEIGKDISRVTHLLVVWEISESNKLYADVLLVEHDRGFIWNKDDLKESYYKNADRFRLYLDSATDTRSLNNHIVLMITSEIMNEDRVLNIIISEIEGGNHTRMPAHIDLRG